MPNPEQIMSKCTLLPLLKDSQKPQLDQDVWKRNEKGGHFRLYKRRHNSFHGKSSEELVLSVSGSELSKVRIIADFTKELGEPSLISRQEARGPMVNNPKIYIFWRKPIEVTSI
jgi:hypothetical protein